jgi:sterol 3beta-glucosyltransferase/vancomycin aglycone glucosyltransferase
LDYWLRVTGTPWMRRHDPGSGPSRKTFRIGIQTLGSEGDIRPFLALAHGLAGEGHQVRLAYTARPLRDYAPEAARLGFEARMEVERPCPGTGKPIEFRALLRSVSDGRWASAERLAAESDLLIAHFMALPLAVAALAAGKPFVLVDLFPRLPSAELPPVWAPRLGTWGNRLAWWLTLRGRDLYFRDALRVLCRRAGIPTITLSALPEQAAAQLLAVSPTLFPRPGDWPEGAHVCGCFAAPADPRAPALPAGLTAFLAEGPPPVFATCGSAPCGKTEVERLMQVVHRGGRRGVVQFLGEATGLGAVEGIYLLREIVPHRALFRHCAAVVHHGGAGTTHAALREGVPSVILSYGLDQPFWGNLLARQGLGPPSLSRRRFRDADLDRAITATGGAEMRSRVRQVGQRLQAEDGVATAIAILRRQGLLP